METTLANSSNGHSPEMRLVLGSISREACVTLVGFGSLIAWVQLYETHLLTNDVSLFNFCLYGSIAQLATFLAMAGAGARWSWSPHARTGCIAGAVGASGMALSLVSPGTALDITGASAMGVSSAILSVSWGLRLSARSPRSILLIVLGALLAATLLCFACTAAGSFVPAACGIALPLLAGGFLLQGKDSSVGTAQTADPKSLPWPFLIILGVCCLAGSFFVGVALNPYIFQSGSISRFGYLFSLAAFAAMLVWAAATSRPKTQVLFIGALILLLMGLFLFSSGLLGSIILPLGLILAAKSCCLALCWITFSTLARTGKLAPVITLSCGLLLCNGTLGRSAGMLVSNHMAPSFPDIALAASACIVAFTLFYAFMVASHPGTNRALSPDVSEAPQMPPQAAQRPLGPATTPVPMPVPTPSASRKREPESLTAEQLVVRARKMQDETLRSFDLTPQERRVARFILREMTYQQIAEKCDISERTVKFHAKNVYSKTGAESRRDFEIKMLAKGR